MRGSTCQNQDKRNREAGVQKRENVCVWADAQGSPLSGASESLSHRKTESQRQRLRVGSFPPQPLTIPVQDLGFLTGAGYGCRRKLLLLCCWEPNPLANDRHKEAAKPLRSRALNAHQTTTLLAITMHTQHSSAYYNR